MKLIIFGSGIYYQRLKSHFVEHEIQCIIDNDIRKQGTLIDKYIICSPEKVDYSKCDYVVVLVKKYEEIYNQLHLLGVVEEKIIGINDLYRIVDEELVINHRGRDIALNKWELRDNKKNILLVSHQLSRTGVPIALMNLALLLRNMGFRVLYMSMGNGTLCEELEINGIDYLIDECQLYKKDIEFKELIKKFDLFIFGTAVLSMHISFFSEFNKPIIWWMHESNKQTLSVIRDLEIPKHVYCFAGGPRVVKALEEYAGLKKVKEFLYFLPNIKNEKERNVETNKIVFALLGAFSRRKAQDILADASKLIYSKNKENYEIVFVGGIYESSAIEFHKKLRNENPEILFLNEMSQAELDEYYKNIDVLVCPSRDDPMPIVVTQAMQNGIPCIVSDEVGQCKYITHGVDGFVFKSEDTEELAQIMNWIIENKDALSMIGKNAKNLFAEYFSEDKMKRNLTQIFEEIID